MPHTLFSLINESHAVRDQPHGGAAFVASTPVADAGVPVEGPPSVEQVDIRATARTLRLRYRAALFNWYEDATNAKHIAVLGEIAAQLEQAAATPCVFELWWIVGGVIEALVEGGLEASKSIEQLLGRTYREIKRLTEETETVIAEAPPRALVNTLLDSVARASSRGGRVSSIKKIFDLEVLTAEKEARSDDEGADIDLPRTVIAEMREATSAHVTAPALERVSAAAVKLAAIESSKNAGDKADKVREQTRAATEAVVLEAEGSVVAREKSAEPHVDLRREVEAHLDVLADMRAGCRLLEVACPVGETTVRTLHRLHGSASVCGAIELARLAQSAARYFGVLHQQQIRMPHSDVALLDTFMMALRALLQAFVDEDEAPPDYSPLRDEFRRRTDLAESDGGVTACQ